MGASSTRVPGFRSVMYSPHSTTSPAMSLPRMCGSFTPGSPIADKEIEMVQRAGTDPDENLILAQLRIRNVFVLQYLRTAEFMNADCFHWELLDR